MIATPDSRWERIKELFANLRPLEPAERARLLDEQCGGEPELRADVEELLNNYDEASGFFKRFPDLANVAANLSLRTFSVGDTVAGRFRIVDFLGQGGMGEVYEAEDLTLSHEHIALKTLRASATADENAIHRLNRELQLARSITHVNVCRVHDVGLHHTASGSPIYFFTMELLKGDTLGARLRLGTMTTTAALPLVRQMVMGLHAAHSAGVVHGDLKPGNVMLVPSPDGTERVAITDFGLARWMPPGAALLSTTTQSFGGGTLAYMAPEQMWSRGATPATDIYALGIIMYELVTGQHPFMGESALDLALGKKPSLGLPPEVDSRWQTAIQKCLQPRPDKRFTSVLDVINELEGKPQPKAKWWIAATAAVSAATLLSLPGVRHELTTLSTWFNKPERTIALMPFENAPRTPEGDAWSAGLTAVVTDHLGSLSRDLGGLRIVPAAEVIGTGLDTLALVQSTLGANLIITGRVSDETGQKALALTLNEASRDALTVRKSERVTITSDDDAFVEKDVLTGITRMLGLTASAAVVQKLEKGMVQPVAEHTYLLGRGYLANGALLPAITALESAVERDGASALTHAALSNAYLDQYDATNNRAFVSKAQTSADAAVDRDPDNARFHVIRARVYRVTSQRERAIQELQRALDLDPDIPDAHRYLAEAYSASGALDKAEEQYRDEIRRHPQYWRAYNTFGAYLYFHGRYSEAATNFVKASEYAPANVTVIANLAGIYLFQGRFAAAENECAKGLKLTPDAVLYNNLGWAYIFQGKFADAIEPLKRAVQLPKADPVVWSSLARACRWEGHHPEEAKAAYETALQLSNEYLYVNPENTEIRSNLGYLLAEAGRGAEALREDSATLAAAPTDALALFTSALTHELTGDRAGAVKALEAAARHGHSMAQIRTHPDLKALRTDPRFQPVLGMAPETSGRR
jgi:serine/threonine protein kinase/Tfp pilus assembly protein PilF